MPSYCVVPNCTSNRRKSGKRSSTFKVPSNGPLREKWLLSIPGLQNFKSCDRVCEQHFDKNFITKEFIKYDNSGNEIARVPYAKPILKNSAIPTIFEMSYTSNTTSNNIFCTDHTYAVPYCLQPTTVKSVVQNESTNLSSANTLNVAKGNVLLNENPQKIKILHDIILPRNECMNIEILDQGINLGKSTIPVNMNSDMKTLENSYITASQYEPSCDNNDYVQNNVECIPLQEHFSPESAAWYDNCTELMLSCESSTEILDEHKLPSTDNQPKTATSDMQCTEELITFDSITFSFENLNNEQKRSNGHIKLPPPWNVNKLIKRTEESLLLTCILPFNGNEKYVLEKTVIIKRSRDIVYEVYSTHVDVTGTKLPQVLEDPSKLPEILKKFKDIRICKGIPATNLTNINENKCLKQDIYCNIRHANCSIISINSERCLWCKKYSKVLLQKMKRIKTTKNFKRVGVTVNSLERKKLKALRNELKAKVRKVKITENRLRLVTDTIEKDQNKVANLPIDVLDKISMNEKIVIREIISAAQKNDARGRRYTNQFIMLCMLMNIRSSSYYEFLRKNEIIPLPCTKTIRDYLSLMGNRCGFDENFFKVFKKSINSIEERQRHGVILLDEIHLRKSVAVYSKNLTYSGLTDMGDEGIQSNNIDDLATHGLVLQFHSIGGTYTQPIAVFASKNSVGGEELAKLIVKAICLLESSGAIIHGVIGDGASSNRKMWKTLGVSGTINELQNSFVHPLDSKRKIFMFSDIPHLFQCIRNRLHNKRQLKIRSDENYIKWEYFKYLYDIDNSNPGNTRVCPKLTRRHLELDNTSKMRVRFATQIFSKSIAVGLQFYAAHKFKQFEGCEATVNFCLRMNNIFDALNRKQPNEGLTPKSTDFALIENTIEWLNNWEKQCHDGLITKDEFLTRETAEGLRITLKSTLQLCENLIENFNFQYLLTGKLNQDNLEKFFGIIRGAAGSNEHPTCPSFLSLYKLLSVYGIIKPPAYGNCMVSKHKPENVITIADLKEIYEKSESTTSSVLADLKSKLDNIIKYEDWEVDDVIEHNKLHSITSTRLHHLLRDRFI